MLQQPDYKELLSETLDRVQSLRDTQLLQEKLGHSLVITEVMKAIGRVQRTISIVKNRQGHNYKYADFSSILNVCYEAFAVEELVLAQPMCEDELGRMSLKTIIMHTPSGQWISSKMAFPALKGTEKNDCQAIGSIQTYWRRYSLLSLIGLDDEDDDGKKADGYAVPTYRATPAPYNGSEYISDKQIGFLKNKMLQYPDQAKQLKNVDISVIKKSEFNGILSLFPTN